MKNERYHAYIEPMIPLYLLQPKCDIFKRLFGSKIKDHKYPMSSSE